VTAPARDLNNLAPSAGIAWTVNPRTVVRGGAGLHHDSGTLFWKARGRAFTGPAGNGRVLVDGSATGLNFLSTPTAFTGADLVPMLPGIRAGLEQRLGSGRDPAVRGVEVIKQGDQIVDPDVTTAYAVHANAGIQREIGAGFVLTADYVLRQYRGLGPLQNTYFVDRNRFNRPRVTGVDDRTGVVSFVRDPVIPQCSAAQAAALDPGDVCSTGPITVFGSDADYLYQGVHLTLDRRLRDGLQVLVGYAYARDRGFVEFVSYDNPEAGSGTNPNHRRHRLTLSGVWQPAAPARGRVARALLDGWSVSFLGQILSAPPLNTILSGLDLDGDGISRTLLPGTGYATLGHGLSADELRTLVTRYNVDVEARTRRVTNPDGSVTIVRPRTPFNQIINPIVLPERFASGDSFITLDLRVARTFPVGPVRFTAIAEVFNVFNIANLTGYNDQLNQPNYGQPSARIGQAFGSGGPRAAQLGARVRF
jgi:hypothetical protein